MNITENAFIVVCVGANVLFMWEVGGGGEGESDVGIQAV